MSLISQDITYLRNLAYRGDTFAKILINTLDNSRESEKRLLHVRVATFGNATLSGLVTAIDGKTLAEGDYVLVKAQTTASENGVYVASADDWTRLKDDVGEDVLVSGMIVQVTEGSHNADSLWMLSTDTIDVGTSNLSFTQLSANLGFSVITHTIYVRTEGSDSTGSGTSAAPYETLQKAVTEVPHNIPPGVRYIIDTTDTSLTLPTDYELPAWKGSESVGYDSTNEFFLFTGAVQIQATPRLVAAISTADATVVLGDILSQTADSITGLITLTLNVARASWAADALKGKFIICSAHATPALVNTTILSSSSTTLVLATDTSLTTGFTIREPSCAIAVTSVPQGTSNRGGLNAYNVDSIAFNGLKITTATGGAAFGLTCSGNGQSIAQMCELDRPQFTSYSPNITRVVNNWIYGARFRATGMILCANSLFQSIGSWVLLNLRFIQIARCWITGGVTLECVAQAPGSTRYNDVTGAIRIENTAIKSVTGASNDGFRFNGGKAQLDSVDIAGCGRDGIRCVDNVGYLHLNKVRSSTQNGVTTATGVGILVNDGMQVQVDSNTTSAGTGDTLRGAGGDMKVGTLPVRTWVDFLANAPTKNQFDIRSPFVTNVASGIDMPAGDDVTGAGTGGCSGSRIFQRS